jgi:site-specific DNA-methyltransferase (adenine-specific)
VTAPDIQIVTADFRAFSPDQFAGFHLLATDPPYSDYVHKHMASHGTHGRGSRARDPGFESLSSEVRGHTAKVIARIGGWSVVFTDHESTHLWRADVQMAGAEYVREKTGVFDVADDIRWIRWSQPQLSGDRPPQTSESVLHFHKIGAKIYSGPGNLTHYDVKCLRGADKHPTEKPLDLMLRIVSWFSAPGQAVLDPFGGAGTTALACRLLGRDCLSIEADARWAPVATRRLALEWIDRDAERFRRWVDETRVEAAAHLSKPAAANGEDANTRGRAERRLVDVERAIAIAAAA